MQLADHEDSQSRGAGRRAYVVHEDAAGEPDGYASYRVRWGVEGPGGTGDELEVEDLFAEEPAVRRELWRYCAHMDLIDTVKATNVALDEDLFWQLEDARAARVTEMSDLLWARLVDVPAALEARRYGARGSLVLEVSDPFRPQASGCYRLEVDERGASCGPTGEPPELSLSAADLAAAYLGGVALVALARAGRVVQHRSGALERAQAMFATPLAPWSATDF
jgi:predicted acetyltransferase